MEQNYSNHVRYYAPHHFVFYPLITICFGTTIWYGIHDEALSKIWYALAVILFFIAWLSYLVRQHYGLVNQNRIVRLELRFRYYVLTNERFELLEKRLSERQIFALRFASDEELPGLVTLAVENNLPPREIKRAIKVWLPDYMRV